MKKFKKDRWGNIIWLDRSRQIPETETLEELYLINPDKYPKYPALGKFFRYLKDKIIINPSEPISYKLHDTENDHYVTAAFAENLPTELIKQYKDITSFNDYNTLFSEFRKYIYSSRNNRTIDRDHFTKCYSKNNNERQEDVEKIVKEFTKDTFLIALSRDARLLQSILYSTYKDNPPDLEQCKLSEVLLKLYEIGNKYIEKMVSLPEDSLLYPICDAVTSNYGMVGDISSFGVRDVKEFQSPYYGSLYNTWGAQIKTHPELPPITTPSTLQEYINPSLFNYSRKYLKLGLSDYPLLHYDKPENCNDVLTITRNFWDNAMCWFDDGKEYRRLFWDIKDGEINFGIYDVDSGKRLSKLDVYHKCLSAVDTLYSNYERLLTTSPYERSILRKDADVDAIKI